MLSNIPEDVSIACFRRKVRMYMEGSGIIAIIVDKEFEKNNALMLELSVMLDLTKKEKNKIIIPIIIDDAEVPHILEKYSCISYGAPDSRFQIRKMIQEALTITKKIEGKQKNSNMLHITYSSVLLAVLAMVLGMIVTYSESLYLFEHDMAYDVILYITVVLSALTITISFMQIIKKRRADDEKEEIESYSDRLKQAISEDVKDNVDNKNDMDALGRMLINLEDINIYYKWSQKQARASFWLAVIMCGLGFCLIGFSVLSVLWLKKGVSESIIPMIGGAVVEVFAGMALIVYKNSLSQLNHYHRALHEDERFLSSVNLLNNFQSEATKEEMLKEIIRNEMAMNIISLGDNSSNNLGNKLTKSS